MKKLALIAIILGSVQLSFGQSELSISTGMAFPSGDFGTNSGGAAKMGFMGDIMYQHQTQDKSKLWIAGMVRFQSYKVDITPFEQAFPGMKISCTNWEAFSFMVGPVVKFNLTESSSFEPRILLGYMAAKSPGVTVSSGGMSQAVDPANGNAFATMLGASYKFKLSNKTSIVGGADYLTANPKFKITGSPGVSSASQEANQQISSFNVIVGLCFKLK